jgi:hypothetical protein
LWTKPFIGRSLLVASPVSARRQMARWMRSSLINQFQG